MKNLKYLLLLFMGLLLVPSCNKEEKIVVDIDSYRRAYDVNSTDPVWKYVSEYYAKYEKTFITDPIPQDYVYNFQSKNVSKMEQLSQDDATLLASVELTDELFFSKYGENFQRKHFPFSIIIASDITYYDEWNYEYVSTDFYTAISFFAFKFDTDILSDSQDNKESYFANVNCEFLKRFFAEYRLELPETYLNIGREYYGVNDWDIYSDEQGYENGFIHIDLNYEEDSTYPTANKDAGFMIEYLIKTDAAERDALFAEYPLLQQKADILMKVLEEEGLDLDLF